MLDRREWMTSLGSMSVLLALTPSSWAAGREYIELSRPVAPVSLGGKAKIEVLEFFMYSCPHCHAFEPQVNAWAQKLPADVVFNRVPLTFRPALAMHQKMYYAIETLKQQSKGTARNAWSNLHAEVFKALHGAEQKKLLDPNEIKDWVKAKGLDGTQFIEVLQSFGVATRVSQADRLVASYQVEGVPSMAVQGRYYTDGTLAGSTARMLEVVNALMQQVRLAA